VSKKISVLVILCVGLLFLSSFASASSASARVRCLISSGRVQVKVDGYDLPVGTYGAKVKNMRTLAVVKTAAGKVQTVTAGIDDIDLDFDTEREGAETFISGSFARIGDSVHAAIVNVNTGNTIASATTSCVKK
jgi:hypothetical protein